MADKPPTVLQLVWERDLVFAGTSGESAMTLDSDSQAGQSPMQALAFGLAGCMAMDVVYILRKGRLDLRGLRADLTGVRADEHPRRVCTHVASRGHLVAQRQAHRRRAVLGTAVPAALR